MILRQLDSFIDREEVEFVLEEISKDKCWIRRGNKIVYQELTSAQGALYMERLRDFYKERMS